MYLLVPVWKKNSANSTIITKISFQTLPIAEKTTVLQEVNNTWGLASFAVQKDWWVVQKLSIGLNINNQFSQNTNFKIVFKIV